MVKLYLLPIYIYILVAPSPAVSNIVKIQDGAKCVYGIAGIFIDTLDLAQIYETGGASLISDRVKLFISKVMELPDKFTTDPQSAILEAYTLFSTANNLKADFFTYVPKCFTFIGHFMQ